MRLTLLGVRGSTPAPGAEFVEFGGHTSSIAVTAEGQDRPTLLLDAGTGVRALPGLLGGRPFDGALVLTHLHWDHIQGLPFCPALDHPASRVAVHLPIGESGSAVAAFTAAMSPPAFPIGPDGLKGDWTFHPAGPGPRATPLATPLATAASPLSGATVTVAPVRHKGGSTLGVRVELDGESLAYLPDHALLSTDGDHCAAAHALADGVSALLHGGPYLSAEAATAVDYGHATVEAAMSFADRCDVGRLVVVHHAPGRTDAALRALEAALPRTPGGRPVTFARQGDVVEVAR